jgi:plastocyanin
LLTRQRVTQKGNHDNSIACAERFGIGDRACGCWRLQRQRQRIGDLVGQNGVQAFSPNPATFGGQQVVFKNNDSVMHRVVLNDGSVDTGSIAPGATSGVVTMPGTGTNYHCSVHPGMIGSVTAASGAAPPPCQGDYCSPY